MRKMNVRGIVNKIVLFTMLLQTHVILFAKSVGDTIKEAANGTAPSSNLTGAFEKLEAQAWIIVGGVSALGIAVFAIILMMRSVSVAATKDGRNRAESMKNIGWVLIAVAIFAAVGTIIAMSKAIGGGIWK